MMEHRKVKAASMGVCVQPSVYLVGDNVSNIDASYVAIDSVLYKLETPLSAVDCCFKVFWALNAKYPPESQHIWLLIQKLVYNIVTKQDKNLTSVNTIITDLK